MGGKKLDTQSIDKSSGRIAMSMSVCVMSMNVWGTEWKDNW